MDLSNLWPTLIRFLTGFTDANKQDEAPPHPADSGDEDNVVQGANEAISALQEFMNQMAQLGLLPLSEPLVVDGWLGPKTDAAIMAAIARLRSLLG